MTGDELPSGVVTFLFTDVEGSTRRWETDADEMRAALASHDKVLRTAIEGHDGFLFSHTGDGFVAAFASPISAVNAAIDAQRDLQLPVRMGLATGEAELRDGDYFGAVLNRAARVMAAGHGGQVLLVDSTAVLLSGVDLIDLGTRRLRDVPIQRRLPHHPAQRHHAIGAHAVGHTSAGHTGGGRRHRTTNRRPASRSGGRRGSWSGSPSRMSGSAD